MVFPERREHLAEGARRVAGFQGLPDGALRCLPELFLQDLDIVEIAVQVGERAVQSRQRAGDLEDYRVCSAP